MKFALKTGLKFDRGSVKGVAYNTKEQFPRMSAAVFTVKGKHPKMKSMNSDRLYFIIKGQGAFEINGKKLKVAKDDVVIVPKNTPYHYWGKMKCFLVHSPAFDRKKEIRY